MLHAEPHERCQAAVILGDGAFHLDLAQRDEQARLELGVEAEQPRGLPEVAAGGGERIHIDGADRGDKRTRRGRDQAGRDEKETVCFLRESRREVYDGERGKRTLGCINRY